MHILLLRFKDKNKTSSKKEWQLTCRTAKRNHTKSYKKRAAIFTDLLGAEYTQLGVANCINNAPTETMPTLTAKIKEKNRLPCLYFYSEHLFRESIEV